MAAWSNLKNTRSRIRFFEFFRDMKRSDLLIVMAPVAAVLVGRDWNQSLWNRPRPKLLRFSQHFRSVQSTNASDVPSMIWLHNSSLYVILAKPASYAVCPKGVKIQECVRLCHEVHEINLKTWQRKLSKRFPIYYHFPIRLLFCPWRCPMIAAEVSVQMAAGCPAGIPGL